MPKKGKSSNGLFTEFEPNMSDKEIDTLLDQIPETPDAKGEEIASPKKGGKKLAIIDDLLNSASKAATKTNISRIDINQIQPNIKNETLYPIDKLRELAESISTFGLFDPLLVVRVENNKYRLVSGHKRYYAIKLLIEEGNESQKEVLCNIVSFDDLDEELALIQANALNRERTPEIIQKEIECLSVNYDSRKAAGQNNGPKRDWIAKNVGLSPRQVTNYLNAGESDLTLTTVKEAATKGKDTNWEKQGKQPKTKKEREAIYCLVAQLFGDDISSGESTEDLKKRLKIETVLNDGKKFSGKTSGIECATNGTEYNIGWGTAAKIVKEFAPAPDLENRAIRELISSIEDCISKVATDESVNYFRKILFEIKQKFNM